MYSGFHKVAGIIGGALALSGCVQMTRHSNMMVFGTNSAIGLRIGVGATSVPEIAVGYTRQEAIVLPLVANIKSVAPGADNLNRLVPCDLTVPVTTTGAKFAVHPCSLVAIKGNSLDSYSVLASFGAKFNAKGSTTAPEAGGGLAQYFSTGMAAQILALNGGASVVSVSKAAVQSATAAPTDAAVKSLFGNDSAFEIGAGAGNAYPAFKQKLHGLVDALPDDAAVKTKIANFELNAKIGSAMDTKCATKQSCLAAIANDDFGQLYGNNKLAMDGAIANW